MDDTHRRGIGGLLMTINFEKTLDSLSWDYIWNTLKRFNFGPSFISWMKIVYTDISNFIINNKVTSNYFPIKCGVHQGDTLSPLLFVMTVEKLVIYLRSDNNIK